MLISNNFSYKITALQISDGDLTLCVFLPENLNYLVRLVPVHYLECAFMSGVFSTFCSTNCKLLSVLHVFYLR